jgi:predicted nicotinamide N-methyase
MNCAHDPAPPSDALLNRHLPLTEPPGLGGLRVHRCRDIFTLWQAWEHECEEAVDPPFWADIWPGAGFLAKYILQNPALVTGKRVLDLGCGGGVVSIAACQGGARTVIANDIDKTALWMTQRNAEANGANVVVCPKDLTNASLHERADLILVAEMFYQREQSRLLLQTLQRAVQMGSAVLIADGERPFAPLRSARVCAEGVVEANYVLEGVHTRRVRLFTLS